MTMLAIIGILLLAAAGLIALGMLAVRVIRDWPNHVHVHARGLVRWGGRLFLSVCLVLSVCQLYQWTLGQYSDEERNIDSLYMRFSYALNAGNYELAFTYMTPDWQTNHQPEDLKETFRFLATTDGKPRYLLWPDRKVKVSGSKAWLHPYGTEFLQFMSGPIFHFEKIKGDCYDCWYISEKFDWSTD